MKEGGREGGREINPSFAPSTAQSQRVAMPAPSHAAGATAKVEKISRPTVDEGISLEDCMAILRAAMARIQRRYPSRRPRPNLPASGVLQPRRIA